jgi:hypothetical protein
MHILQFDCSICKKLYGKPKQRHGLKKGAELTAHEWFAQCMGCGTFGIKLVDDDQGLESYQMATMNSNVINAAQWQSSTDPLMLMAM